MRPKEKLGFREVQPFPRGHTASGVQDPFHTLVGSLVLFSEWGPAPPFPAKRGRPCRSPPFRKGPGFPAPRLAGTGGFHPGHGPGRAPADPRPVHRQDKLKVHMRKHTGEKRSHCQSTPTNPHALPLCCSSVVAVSPSTCSPWLAERLRFDLCILSASVKSSGVLLGGAVGPCMLQGEV